MSLRLRLAKSATFTSTTGFLSKSLNLILVLPIVLSKIPVEEVNLFLLFSTIVSFVLLVDLGFSPTFIRFIGYSSVDSKVDSSVNTNIERFDIRELTASMSLVYTILSLVGFVLMVSIGSYFVQPSILATSNPIENWAAWFILCGGSFIQIFGYRYSTLLLGHNHVSKVMMNETLINCINSIFASLIALLSPNIFLLVLNQQFWILALVIKNKISTSKEIENIDFSARINVHRSILRSVIAQSWKSALGNLFSRGLIIFSGIVYSRIGSVSNSASYLLSLRILNVFSQFSRAPFYSKIPKMNQLYSMGKINELIQQAQKSIFLSLVFFSTACSVFCILGNKALILIGSDVFITGNLWILLSIGFFLERYGALHIQLYSISNNIIWHISNGISGMIYVISIFVLLPSLEIYAFPVALIISNGLFYCWFNAIHSYKLLGLRLVSFEIKTSFVPGIILLLSIISFYFI